MVRQVSLMMLSLNMMDYPMSFLSLAYSVWGQGLTIIFRIRKYNRQFGYILFKVRGRHINRWLYCCCMHHWISFNFGSIKLKVTRISLSQVGSQFTHLFDTFTENALMEIIGKCALRIKEERKSISYEGNHSKKIVTSCSRCKTYKVRDKLLIH